jgi:hypothetical protein
VPVSDIKADKWFVEAYKNYIAVVRPHTEGTYEVCGPHFQGNPERLAFDILVKHGKPIFADCPRTYCELAVWFADKNIEGVVWHHPDGRMCKIKKSDFGLARRNA